MARAFVFGSGFDSLANQRQALNRFLFDVASRNEMNRMASQEAAARLNLSAQAQADEVAARNASFDLAAQNAANQAAFNAAKNRDAAREFSINTALKVADDQRAIQAARQAAQKDARDFAFNQQKQDSLEESRANDALNSVLVDINAGNLIDPEALEARISSLPSTQQNAARKQFKDANDRRMAASAAVYAEVARLNQALPKLQEQALEKGQDVMTLAESLNTNKDKIAFDIQKGEFVRRADVTSPLPKNTGITLAPETLRALGIR